MGDSYLCDPRLEWAFEVQAVVGLKALRPKKLLCRGIIRFRLGPQCLCPHGARHLRYLIENHLADSLPAVPSFNVELVNKYGQPPLLHAMVLCEDHVTDSLLRSFDEVCGSEQLIFEQALYALFDVDHRIIVLIISI